MKILVLSKKMPFPLKDGESIAIHNLAKSLADNGASISLLTMNTTRHYVESGDEALHSSLPYYHKVYTIKVDNSISWFGALYYFARRRSYNIGRFFSNAYNQKLIELLQSDDFDIIQLETLYLTPYLSTIRKYSNAKIVLRAHNIEHEIWERMVQNEGNWLKKLYIKDLAHLLKIFERDQLKKVDFLLPISFRDQRQFRAMGFDRDNLVVPIGINVSEYQTDFRAFNKELLSLAFIGSLDWMPNIEGIKWFLDKIWLPNSKQFHPIKLYIAGRNTPDWLKKQKNESVEVIGEVEDAKEYFNQHALMVVPLLSGSGMRAKIIEGMALGRVVITTTIGLEGIDAHHMEHVIVADRPEEFIESLQYCIEHRESLRQIGQNARQLVLEKYNSHLISKKLAHLYEQLAL